MRGGMDGMKRGGGMPMDDDALMEEAIREVASRIDGYDSDSLMGAYRSKNAPPEGMAAEGAGQEGAAPVPKEECPECAKGECMEPEHMDEETLQAMLAEGGGAT